MNIAPAKQATPMRAAEFNVPPTADTDTYARTPSEQVNNLPFDLLAPVRKN